MSTEHHTTGHGDNVPIHQDVAFEPRDVRVNPILKFLLYLGIFVVASYFVVLGVYHGLTKYWGSTYAQPMQMRTEMGATLPPEPRMQGMPGHLTDPQADLRSKLEEDQAENEKLSWIDQKAGLAQIPVKDAMKLIAQKGLPATAAPPAEKK